MYTLDMLADLCYRRYMSYEPHNPRSAFLVGLALAIATAAWNMNGQLGAMNQQLVDLRRELDSLHAEVLRIQSSQSRPCQGVIVQ